MRRQPQHKNAEFEQKPRGLDTGKYTLRLYVAGATDKANHAILGINKIFKRYFKDRCEREVVDIYQKSVLAKGEQIPATPTLAGKPRPPLRPCVGNIAGKENLPLELDLIDKRKNKNTIRTG